MEIICNGEKRQVEPETFLGDFLKTLSLNPDTVVVECDGVIIPRDDYDNRVLEDGERLELIRFVGGG